MPDEAHRVIVDPNYGYRRLARLPESGELTRFYQSRYYDLIRKGGRAPELRRLMAGGEQAARERQWLGATLYADICATLVEHAPGKRVLDVGSGTGEFLVALSAQEFEAVGIEPSAEAAEVARSAGLTAHACTLEEYIRERQPQCDETFDAITMLNVLEHVPDPADVVALARALLRPNGVLCVRVPNDFTELQSAAREASKKDPWWIAVPDHINYFDFASLEVLLGRIGFQVVYSQGDFPMEMFLLMGRDYVGNSEVGDECHKMRIRFEMALPAPVRRRLYSAFAGQGMGRNCLVFARRSQ